MPPPSTTGRLRIHILNRKIFPQPTKAPPHRLDHIGGGINVLSHLVTQNMREVLTAAPLIWIRNSSWRFRKHNSELIRAIQMRRMERKSYNACNRLIKRWRWPQFEWCHSIGTNWMSTTSVDARSRSPMKRARPPDSTCFYQSPVGRAANRLNKNSHPPAIYFLHSN